MTAGPVVPRGTQLSAMQTSPLVQSADLTHDSPSALSTGAGDPLLLLQEPVAATKAIPPASEAMDASRDPGRVFNWTGQVISQAAARSSFRGHDFPRRLD